MTGKTAGVSFGKISGSARSPFRRIRELLVREDIVRAYSDRERERVTEVLRYQAGKYRYMLNGYDKRLRIQNKT